jgi:hypothetical protein
MCHDLKAEMAFLAKKDVQVLGDRGGALGFHYQGPASWEQPDRPLSTGASHGLEPEVTAI